MKIHFVWPISANYKMITMSKILIKSAKGLDAYFTIFVQKKDYNETIKNLGNIAEVVAYETETLFLNPWDSTPKWTVKPKGDIIIGVDADILVLNKKILLNYIKKSHTEKSIYGTIAHNSPFSLEEWQNLFKECGMSDDFKYKFHLTNEPAPYYINNGAVIMPVDFLEKFRYYHKKWLIKLTKNYRNCAFISQIATTLTIKEAKLNAKEASVFFNYLESDNPCVDACDINKIAIFHYNLSKNVNQIKKTTKELKKLFYFKNTKLL